MRVKARKHVRNEGSRRFKSAPLRQPVPGLRHSPGMSVVVHPQSIGRAHMITRLEELIVHMKERGAWFATLSEIADATERAV